MKHEQTSIITYLYDYIVYVTHVKHLKILAPAMLRTSFFGLEIWLLKGAVAGGLPDFDCLHDAWHP